MLVGTLGARAFIPKLSVICNVIFVQFLLFQLCVAIVSYSHRQLIIKCLVIAVDFVLFFCLLVRMWFSSVHHVLAAHIQSHLSFFVEGQLRAKKVLLDFVHVCRRMRLCLLLLCFVSCII